MKHLVIGAGEIGKALQQIFNCDIRDKESDLQGQYDVLHIAYPYTPFFDEVTDAYILQYQPKYVVVHSTVPVKTCKVLGLIHSPCTGVHPHLKESILTFTKFVSDKDMVEEFRKYGIPAVYMPSSDDTEAGKLFALLIYGINVLLEKEIYQYCKDNHLNYDNAYTKMVKMYNDGYDAMGMPWARMYELAHKEGGIGGHCVVQNAPMLKTDFSRILEKLNAKFMV